MHTERHVPSPLLSPFLIGAIEGWELSNGAQARLREVPFPGIPLIFGIEGGWQVDTDRHESFVAGLHARPTFVQPDAPNWSCIELRLTPIAAHRILGLAMHELSDLTVALEDVVPTAATVTDRIRDAGSWFERFELIEAFMLRRLAESRTPAPEVEWSWERLRRTAGCAPIGPMATEIGWSHRRLIARFREQVGMAPKAVARVMRFDHAVQAIRSAPHGLADVAYDCGYFDQAHMTRDFRDLGGTTPRAFRASLLASGGVAA